MSTEILKNDADQIDPQMEARVDRFVAELEKVTSTPITEPSEDELRRDGYTSLLCALYKCKPDAFKGVDMWNIGKNLDDMLNFTGNNRRRKRNVIEMRHGIGEHEQMNFDEIAKKLGITEKQAKYTYSMTMSRMRSAVKDNIPYRKGDLNGLMAVENRSFDVEQIKDGDSSLEYVDEQTAIRDIVKSFLSEASKEGVTEFPLSKGLILSELEYDKGYYVPYNDYDSGHVLRLEHSEDWFLGVDDAVENSKWEVGYENGKDEDGNYTEFDPVFTFSQKIVE